MCDYLKDILMNACGTLYAAGEASGAGAITLGAAYNYELIIVYARLADRNEPLSSSLCSTYLI